MKRIVLPAALLILLVTSCLPTRYTGKSVDLTIRGDTINSVLFGSLTFYEGDISKFYFTMTDSLDAKKKYDFYVDIKGVGNNYFHAIIPPGDYLLSSWWFQGQKQGKQFYASGRFGDISQKIIRIKQRTLVYLGRILVSQIGTKVFLTIKDNADADFAWLKKTYPNSPWLGAQIDYAIHPGKKRFSDQELQEETRSLVGGSPSPTTGPVVQPTPDTESQVPFAPPGGLFEME